MTFDGFFAFSGFFCNFYGDEDVEGQKEKINTAKKIKPITIIFGFIGKELLDAVF